MNYFASALRISLIIIACAACTPKKEVKVVTRENVKDVLTQYGKENPETEVLIETDYGNMRIKLYEDTPLHRANFVKQIKDGFYEKPEFYRIIYRFVIQGGEPGKRLPYDVPAEIKPNHFHKTGALAMARLEENNPQMQSSSTEFYIIHGGKYPDWEVTEDAKMHGITLSEEQRRVYTTVGGDMSLDEKYTVFGEVVEGLDVIEKIASVKVYNEEKPLKKVPFKISVVR
jgi:peptidyl-prolyl cis-trans isomerase B (cyclophilin B)